MTVSMPTTTDEVITKPAINLEFVVANEDQLEKPYKIVIQNDDVTPMEFVVLILMTIFELAQEQAMVVMETAHTTGRALVTVLPYKEAQGKVYTAQSIARDASYPLTFYLEPA